MSIRSAVVAGHFYPGDKATLENELKKYLVPHKKINNAIAVIAPHAGYIYSGKTAGAVYSSIDVPDVVFIMCPNHTGLGYPISLHPAETWVTPVGRIQSDQNILKEIKNKIPQAEFDKSSQLREHSLEVQLPFIQTLNPNAKIVPITLAGLPFEMIQKLGVLIADIMIGLEKIGKKSLIVASSDMTHFESKESAKYKDDLAIERIKKLDTKGFMDILQEKDISVCGLYPISVTIEAMLRYSEKLSKNVYVKLVDYSNSGDVTGDYNDVVAYAGLVFYY
jgi:MEMO1 family protein